MKRLLLFSLLFLQTLGMQAAHDSQEFEAYLQIPYELYNSAYCQAEFPDMQQEPILIHYYYRYDSPPAAPAPQPRSIDWPTHYYDYDTAIAESKQYLAQQTISWDSYLNRRFQSNRDRFVQNCRINADIAHIERQKRRIEDHIKELEEERKEACRQAEIARQKERNKAQKILKKIETAFQVDLQDQIEPVRILVGQNTYQDSGHVTKLFQTVISRAVAKHQPDTGILPIYEKHVLAAGKDFSQATPEQIIQANFMIACFDHLPYESVFEVASAGVDALHQALHETDPIQQAYHQKVADLCYKLLQENKTAQYPLMQIEKPTTQTLTFLHEQTAAACDAIDPSDASYSRHQKRLTAFQTSLQQQTCETKEYDLQPETIGFLQAHGINYRVFLQTNGLAIQHQLNTELIDIVQQSAHHAASHANSMSLCTATADLASISQIFNKSGRLEQAVALTDATHGIFTYGKAFFSGIGDGIYNIGAFFKQAIEHPAETTQELATSLAAVCYYTFVILEEWTALTHYMETDLVKYHEQSEKIGHALAGVKSAVGNYWQNRSGPEHVRDATALITEVVLPTKGGKILGSLSKTFGPACTAFAGHVQKHAKKLPGKILQEVLTGEQLVAAMSIEERAAALLTSCKRQAEKIKGKVGSFFSRSIPLHKVLEAKFVNPGIAEIVNIKQLEEFRTITKNFTDCSMLAQHEITYLNLCHWFYPTYQKYNKIIKNLNLKIVYEGVTYEIDSFGLFHSIIGDLPLKRSGKPSGGHCNYQNMLSSIFEVTIEEQLPHGFQQARLHNIKKPTTFKSSTLFPESWSPEQCIETVIEAIQNPKKIKEIKNEKGIIKRTFELTHQNECKFEVHIHPETKRANFHPSNRSEIK